MGLIVDKVYTEEDIKRILNSTDCRTEIETDYGYKVNPRKTLTFFKMGL